MDDRINHRLLRMDRKSPRGVTMMKIAYCFMCKGEHDVRSVWCPHCGVFLGAFLNRANTMMPGVIPTRSNYAAGARWYKTPELAERANRHG